MAGSSARGDGNECDNCNSVLAMLKKMDEKMDTMQERFNGVEALMKQENEKLSNQLKKVEGKYEEACTKIQAMASEINRLKQDNLARNLLIKGVPEIEKDNDHLKIMVGLIFEKLRFPTQMTYIDCYRIGRKKENTCRPIVVVVFNVGLKNVIIRDKRSMKLSCANFSNDKVLWGTPEQLIYIDEHLTKENHMLFMFARKLKSHGFKFVWTRNGRVFVRFSEKSQTIVIESVSTINRLIEEAKAYEKSLKKSGTNDAEVEVMSDVPELITELESEGGDTETEKYSDFVDNPPKGRQKRRQYSPNAQKQRAKTSRKK